MQRSREALRPEPNRFDAVLPDTDTLRRALAACLSGADGSGGLTIEDRSQNVRASSAPSEIVTCRLGNGEQLKVLCKYDAGADYSIGHRGGTAREALVYDKVLTPLGVVPRFFGSYRVRESGETWLFIEYLGPRLRMPEAPHPEAMRLSARWLGRFHRLNEPRLAERDLAFLHRYDADYLFSWPHHTAQLAGPLIGEFPWLPEACARAPELLSVLCKRPQTVIHGEYYPKNILWIDTDVCPIDWESAAIGPGEIDLASLTVDWGAEVEADARREYSLARWPHGEPEGTNDALIAARLYWAFRWLGECSKWTLDPKYRWCLYEIHQLACISGLIN
ncbi:MAG: aminoglycoside phosphotransferase family protein [Betaproteobacteria bacterium]|nr:aminoglycoside phosphotransferase family protein [Betaproteobacteria bacterium]